MDGDRPVTPELLLWFELPDGVVVHNELCDPRSSSSSLVDALRSAMASPLVGEPRRPARVRVARESDARLLREELGDTIEVVRAATPEIDLLVEDLQQYVQNETPSENWLDDVDPGAPEVVRFFEAARALYRAAPWAHTHDQWLVRVDAPELGLEGACVSILGAGGESFGFLLFPSISGFDAFVEAAEEALDEPPLDWGTTWLALSFERGADVSPKLRKGVSSRNLPVTGPDAYPLPSEHTSSGMPRRIDRTALVQLGATAAALSLLFSEHGRTISDEEEQLSVSVEPEGYCPMRLKVPYDAEDELGSPPAIVRPAEPGRSPLHELDERLTGLLARYASERFGKRWERAAAAVIEVGSLQLGVPWSLYIHEVEGRPVFEHFLSHRGAKLTRRERAWLEAQREARLSIWEVTRTDPGVGLELHDLLTGETRFVNEVSGSRDLTERVVLLTRVVECNGEVVLCGMHPNPLAPLDAEPALEAARAKLGKTGPIARDKLRGPKTARHLLDGWEAARQAAEDRYAMPPRLQNTDGEDLLLTVDRFSFEPDARERVRAAIASLEDAEPGENADTIVFLRPGNAMHPEWDNTVTGRAVLSKSGLRLETNSIPRADALRAQVETACGAALRHRAREHSDPEALLRDPGKRSVRASPEISSAEAHELVRELKARQIGAWPDTPIPALGGKTPRAAAKTRAGRQRVDALLREMEYYEGRAPVEARSDLAQLRRELGLD